MTTLLLDERERAPRTYGDDRGGGGGGGGARLDDDDDSDEEYDDGTADHDANDDGTISSERWACMCTLLLPRGGATTPCDGSSCHLTRDDTLSFCTLFLPSFLPRGGARRRATVPFKWFKQRPLVCCATSSRPCGPQRHLEEPDAVRPFLFVVKGADPDVPRRFFYRAAHSYLEEPDAVREGYERWYQLRRAALHHVLARLREVL